MAVKEFWWNSGTTRSKRDPVKMARIEREVRETELYGRFSVPLHEPPLPAPKYVQLLKHFVQIFVRGVRLLR